ncbi:MAG TPA: AMP-binding protein [Candidatus Bathyarchaeia archaeon]|nr:AMP-binding protein [Candidatus Bathyarchaeia archaeon]
MSQASALVERRIVGIVGELVRELGGPSAGRTPAPDDLLDRDLGIGSLERVELLLRIEKAFGVRLPDSVMAEAASPRDLARAVCESARGEIEAAEPISLPGAGVPAPDSARTLVEVLAWHAHAHPDRTHILLRQEDGSERPITYGQLWLGARRAASGLRRLGGDPSSTVALMLRTEQAFFEAFFGALLAGLVPVPIYPPFRRDRIEEHARRQAGILSNAEARGLVTFAEGLPVGRLLRALVPSLRLVTTVPDLAAPAEELPLPRAVAEEPALIQYTSGSTGEPKGVLLSHANLLANIRAIGQAIDIGPDDVAVSWLPLYHDMGLIGCWLGALYFGVPLVLLSPLAFLARPERWLWALHAHRGTVSAAPNFAFDLCARRVADEALRGLDLSSWRLAMNGSEAVSAETVDSFTRRFAAYGFKPEVMCPVYGLAEASVALTVPRLGGPPRIDRVEREIFERQRRAQPAEPDDPAPLCLTGCGRALPGHEVRVVDDKGRPLGERVEGSIEFRGPSVTAGYFRNPSATRSALRDGWMDSGDLGYLADGDLFVTGRRKDLIIKAGRNLYPQEVEEIVAGVPGIRRGCIAAFAVPDPSIGTERLVVIAESRQTLASERSALQGAAQDRIVAALGVPADTVLIGPPGTVLKTSSGKIRRSATREAYLRGQLGLPRGSARVQWLRLLRSTLRPRLRRAASRLARWAAAAYVGMLLLVIAPALWLGVLVAPSPRMAARGARLWCRIVLALSGCAVRVEGTEQLLAAHPAVIVVNHASYLDAVLLIATLPGEYRFVAKRELLHWPLVGRVIRKVGHLTVERSPGRQSVADAERVADALRSGSSVVVFPEGTFVRVPGILPFRLGAFKAAVETRCPVVPVAMLGTRQVLPADTLLPSPGPLTLAVGDPLQPAGTGWPEMVRLRDESRTWIARRSGERLLERTPAP